MSNEYRVNIQLASDQKLPKPKDIIEEQSPRKEAESAESLSIAQEQEPEQVQPRKKISGIEVSASELRHKSVVDPVVEFE